MNYSYFVGLDVGKKSFDASLMTVDEEELIHRSFANTEPGIRSLLAWVKSHVVAGSEILFCAENMGSYVTTLCICSQQLSFSLALECPLTIKKSIGLQRVKNDRIDARRIASYTVLHHPNHQIIFLFCSVLLSFFAPDLKSSCTSIEK